MSRVWVAHYDDWSDLGIFATEVEALRHAVDHSGMQVKSHILPWLSVRTGLSEGVRPAGGGRRRWRHRRIACGMC